MSRELLNKHLDAARWLVKTAMTAEDPLVVLGLIVRAKDRLNSAVAQAFVEAEPSEVPAPSDPCPCGGDHVAADHDMVMAAELEATR